MKHFLKRTSVLVSGVVIFVLGMSTPMKADPLPIGVWTEFSFTAAGTPATGCFPNDPAGNFCIPSSGTPSTFLGAPPWTFTSPVASTLTVTDAFEAGDRFQLFDSNASIGRTFDHPHTHTVARWRCGIPARRPGTRALHLDTVWRRPCHPVARARKAS